VVKIVNQFGSIRDPVPIEILTPEKRKKGVHKRPSSADEAEEGEKKRKKGKKGKTDRS
jgi:hypothetical protein